MKYIRTKDGRIFSLNEFKYEKKYHWYRPNEKYLSRLDINFTCWHWCFDDEYDLIPEVLGKIMVERLDKNECKFADTIEELCDEIVVMPNLHGSPMIMGGRKADYDYELLHEIYGENVYGAIWTGKGLIYVAKMNDKGELELL